MSTNERIDRLHQRVYDMLLYIYPLLAKYPKFEKFTLQKETRSAMLLILEELIKYQKTGTKSHLYNADTQLQVAKEYIRLANDLKYSAMNAQHYRETSKQLAIIGSELGQIIEEIKK